MTLKKLIFFILVTLNGLISPEAGSAKQNQSKIDSTEAVDSVQFQTESEVIKGLTRDNLLVPSTDIWLPAELSDRIFTPSPSKIWFKFHLNEEKVTNLTRVFSSTSDTIINHLATDRMLLRTFNKPSLGNEEMWYYNLVRVFDHYYDSTTIKISAFTPVKEFVIEYCDSLSSPPQLIHWKKVHYPRLAKEAGLEGTLVLQVLIGRDGTVKDHKIVKSTGTSSLDKAAIRVAYDCKYEPGAACGSAVSVWMEYQLEFDIEIQRRFR